MKRKELQAKRSLFVETPPPQKKKPRRLFPGLSGYKIPVVVEEEPFPGVKIPKLITAPLFPSFQNLEDPIDAFLKEYDYLWKSFDWTQQEEQRKERLKELERSLEQKGLAGIVEYAEAGGFWALKNDRVVETLIKLQQTQACGETSEKRAEAKKWINEILKAMTVAVVQGRRELSHKKKEEIVAEYKRWFPICQELNRDFKRLWGISEWHTSKEFQEDTRERLAKKYSISVGKVKDIEFWLQDKTRHGRKATPWEVTLRLVAGKDLRGEKTVEKLYRDFLKDHPDRRTKRKNPTTPIVDERTP